MIIDKIEKKITERDPITKDEALFLFTEVDLIELGELAYLCRWLINPENRVSYVIYRNINYTNVCISLCSFCAFARHISDKDSFSLKLTEIIEKIKEATLIGCDAILLQGGLHPHYKLDYYIEILKTIKNEFPLLHIHGFSPPEIIHIANLSGLSIEKILEEMQEAGLDSIPGGGAEILSDRIRKIISPRKCTTSEWLKVMEIAHSIGIKTSATMMFGSIETYEDRVEHLEHLRNLQSKTKGFTSFIPWTYKPNNKALPVKEASSVDYLKTLAISRIYLDNFQHIEASIVTQGPKVAQIALSFGADDIGSVMIEENVVKAAGTSYILKEEELIRLIKEAGFRPAKRNVFYTHYHYLKDE